MGHGKGLIGALSTVDHKIIGRRYIVTAFIFLFLGGLPRVVMRMQLARPENGLIGPDLYNQLFTMHGTTMMFLFAVPIDGGVRGLSRAADGRHTQHRVPAAECLLLLVYLFGGLMIWVAFVLNIGPDVGWFAYVPLSGPEFSPGKRADVWAQMITFTEVSALAVAIEIIVTVFKQRAPGMTLDRIPLFVWAMLVNSFVIIFAMPAVMIASHLADPRPPGRHAFLQPGGRRRCASLAAPVLVLRPSRRSTSSSCRRPAWCRPSSRPSRAGQVFGYLPLVLSLIATGFLSFGLWVHHMFTTGLPQLGASFFTASSMLIAIPNGIQIFCWIATLWDGRPVFRTPLLFVLGFFFIFVVGGLSGLMLASVPLDTQVHDTYFVVAHFHYVLIGGDVFPLFGAIYYWFPKFTGRMMSERLGKWHFWLAFIGFNVAFFPMHILGPHGHAAAGLHLSARDGLGHLNLLVIARRARAVRELRRSSSST